MARCMSHRQTIATLATLATLCQTASMNEKATHPSLYEVVAAICDALAEASARLAWAVLAVALVFGAVQLRGGDPTGGAPADTVPLVAIASVVALLAFRAAAHLLTEPGQPHGAAVTA